MKMRLLLPLCAILALAVGVTGAMAGGGNSANAKKCQKGGWQSLYDSAGNPFASEEACTSYAAKGGTLSAAADISVSGALLTRNTFNITVSNAGPGTAAVTVEGQCDAGAITVAIDGQWAFTPVDAQTGRWTASLASGQSKQFLIGCYDLGSGAFEPGHVEVYSSSLPDPDSTPNNGNSAEDDYFAIVPAA